MLSAERAEQEFGMADDERAKASSPTDFGDSGGEQMADLLPWSASNHEAMVMTSRGPNKGSLHMLCKNPNKMRNGTWALQFFRQNSTSATLYTHVL